MCGKLGPSKLAVSNPSWRSPPGPPPLDGGQYPKLLAKQIADLSELVRRQKGHSTAGGAGNGGKGVGKGGVGKGSGAGETEEINYI